MVGAGAGAIDDLEAFVLAMGDVGDDIFEGFGVELTGAGAGDEDAVFGEELEGELVEVVIFCVADFVFFSEDKFRGIDHDEVPFASVFDHGADPSEGVGVGEFNFGLVEVGVSFGHVDGFFIEIDGGDFGCSAEGSGDGEAARVAAEVEDGFSGCHFSEGSAVVALVAEEAGFVTCGEIDFVAQVIFEDFNGAEGVGGDSAVAGDALDSGEVLIDFDDDAPCFEELVHEGQPFFEAQPCGEGGDFDGEDVAEFVGNDSGEEVGIAVDGAVAFGFAVEFEDVLAEFGGADDGTFEKFLCDFVEGMAHDAQGHACLGVPQSPSKPGSLFANDLDQISGLCIPRNLPHHLGPNRRMKRLIL